MKAAVELRIQAFGAQKNGMRPSDWEDSAAFNRRTGRMAIADGASSSFAAQQWSRLLVAEFVNSDLAEPPQWNGWVANVRDAWSRRPRADDADVPAYLETARAESARLAYATLVGAAVVAEHDKLWLSVMSIGDSCLFVVRDHGLVATVPAEAMTMTFDSHPALLGSSADPAGRVEAPNFAKIELHDGDSIFIASDALAERIRDWGAESGDVWQMLSTLRSEQFASRVEAFRAAGMANDDVVLLRCCVTGGSASTASEAQR